MVFTSMCCKAFVTTYWVDSYGTLSSLLTKIGSEDFVCIDTEFIPEKTYKPKLELIQIGIQGDAYLVDFRENESIGKELLEALSEMNHITVVFHALINDMQIIFNIIGTIPKNVFDSQIAAKFCGFRNPSYGQLVDSLMEIKLDKSMQRTNWSNRPLTDKEIEYASNDVTYLQEIYQILLSKLKENGNLEKYEEEINKYNYVDYYLPVDDTDLWKTMAGGLSERIELVRLKFLAAWREQRAKKKDKVPSMLIKNKDLKLIAKLGRDWESDRTLGRYKGLAFGINPSLEKAENSPNNSWPNVPELPKKIDQKIILVLRAVRDQISVNSGIDASVICPTHVLENFDSENIPESLRTGWRASLFTEHALNVLNGNTSIKIEGSSITF